MHVGVVGPCASELLGLRPDDLGTARSHGFARWATARHSRIATWRVHAGLVSAVTACQNGDASTTMVAQMRTPPGSATEDAGPFRLYERWPLLHLAVATVIVIVGAWHWPWVMEHDRWLWFGVVAIPMLALHEWEEFVYPGTYRRWFNVDVCGSGDPELPLTKRSAAFYQMPLIVIFPLLALLGARWPFLGLAGLYGLAADALFHLAATSLTRRYSPGTITALLLYIPVTISATWFLVADGQVSLAELLAAVLTGVLGFTLLLFLTRWYPAPGSGH